MIPTLLAFATLAASLMPPAPYIRTVAPGETVRVLTVEQSRAIHESGGPPVTMARIMVCESNGDTTALGAAGEVGAWQVTPRWWGAVPSDIVGQAQQAARIMAEHGDGPWTTKGGCVRWTRP